MPTRPRPSPRTPAAAARSRRAAAAATGPRARPSRRPAIAVSAEREADGAGGDAQPNAASATMPPTSRPTFATSRNISRLVFASRLQVRGQHPRDRPEHREAREHREQRRDLLPLVRGQDQRDQRIRDEAEPDRERKDDQRQQRGRSLERARPALRRQLRHRRHQHQRDLLADLDRRDVGEVVGHVVRAGRGGCRSSARSSGCPSSARRRGRRPGCRAARRTSACP